MRSKSIARRFATTACAAALCGALAEGNARTTPMFLPDDPVPVDDDTRVDASRAQYRGLGRLADFVLNTFRAPGDRRQLPAQNVNTLGEVPDSSWFTNRVGARAMSIDAIVRGPDRVERLEVKRWILIEGKSEGRQPGFRAVDAADPTRTVYQLEFDPQSNPEMATGAEIIGTALYHAFGYHVVENYLIELDPDRLSISPDATMSTAAGTRRFTRSDLNALLRNVARKADGRYRALASRFAEGRYLGPFRYYGTRADDPNDIVPHEHRRELRGNRVFAAWLNHDDSRAGNSLDMLVGEGGRQYIKHYMFDFGSILGSGTNEADHPWVGSEYVVEPKPGLLTLGTLGLWRRPFIAVDAPPGLPAAGNFTANGFEPERWKPHYPNQAFRHLQPEDAFWAARIIASVTPDAIAAVVAKARFSDPRATDYVTGVLLRRRDGVLRRWLSAVNPVVNPRIESDVLRFDNAAEGARLAEAGSRYNVTVFRYDNGAGTRAPIAAPMTYSDETVPMPSLATTDASFAGAEVRTLHPDHPSWAEPVRFYFRRSASGWIPVGIERGDPWATSLPSMHAAEGNR